MYTPQRLKVPLRIGFIDTDREPQISRNDSTIIVDAPMVQMMMACCQAELRTGQYTVNMNKIPNRVKIMKAPKIVGTMENCSCIVSQNVT